MKKHLSRFLPLFFAALLLFAAVSLPAAAEEAESPVTEDTAAENDDTLNPKETTEEEPPEPIAVEGISLAVKDITVRARETIDPGLEIFPADADDQTALWVSDNPKVAEVDENGVITAVGLGEATVTVTVAEFTASCRVTVKYFSDVPDSVFYHDAVYWALANGITNGVNDADFGPDQTCSRAMAVTLLYRVNASPKTSGKTPFTDVPADSYYAAAVNWAYQNGIVTGTSATVFSPNQNCTRAQIVSMLWRCKRQWPQKRASFSDVVSPAYYYYPAAWAAERGVTTGVSPTRFAPDEPCARSQIVTFLFRCQPKGDAILNKSAWQLYYPKAEAVLNSVGRDIRSAFRWSSGLTYYGHGKPDMPDSPAPGSEWFADFGFANHKGNCYTMSATFWEMAVSLGYEARQMTGKVANNRGGAIHSWVEVDVGGKTYVCDASFAHSHGGGYMFSYGKKGTWRYIDYTVMKR